MCPFYCTVVSFDKHIQLCKHQHKEDLEPLHHPFPDAPCGSAVLLVPKRWQLLLQSPPGTHRSAFHSYMFYFFQNVV